MQDVQEVFNRIQETKKKQKDLRTTYKDALAQVKEYEEVVDKLNTLRARKKQIETTVKEEFTSELQQLDECKIDLASDQEILNDAVVTKMMKGEEINLVDEYQNKYEPVFQVRFKKV